MADPRFFKKAESISVQALADLSGSKIAGKGDVDHLIEDVAPLDKADAAHVSFLDNTRYVSQFENSKAGACFVHEQFESRAPEGMIALVSDNPYKAYALAAQYFYPADMPEAVIEDGAFVADDAQIGEGCRIESGAVIKSGVQLGKGCWIEGGAVIAENVVLGDNVRVGSNATLSHTLIGNNVRLYPGVRIGQDGFGFAIDPAGYVKVPQLGRVVIEDHVEIGANTTIDRGAGPDTVIGQGTWIDNLVQIGHNVRIGKGCVIVAQVGISGSTVLEDYVMVGGQAGLAGHLHIGSGARVAAQSGVMRDIPAGEEQMGYPALPMRQFMRQVATLNRLGKGKKNDKR